MVLKAAAISYSCLTLACAQKGLLHIALIDGGILLMRHKTIIALLDVAILDTFLKDDMMQLSLGLILFLACDAQRRRRKLVRSCPTAAILLGKVFVGEVMLVAHECSCFFGLLLVKVSGRSVEHGHLPRCVHKDGIIRRLFSVSRMNGLRGLYDGRLFG